MSLYLTPIGLVIASVFWLVAGITVLVPAWRRLKDKPHRWALFGPLLGVVVLLPYADELWISWHFHQLCKVAGVHVVRRVEVEGFYDSTRSTPHGDVYPGHIEELEKSGFQFMEYRSDDATGRIVRAEKKDGRWQKIVLDRPTARYHYRFADEPETVPAGFQLEKREMQVVDTEAGEVIGTDVRFHRYPGLVEGIWVRFFGSGQTTCEGAAPKPPELRHLLYHYVLIPKKQE